MLNVIIFVILCAGFFIGIRRGLILQVIHMAGLVISFIVAFLYYKEFSQMIKFWIPYSGGEDGTFALFADGIFLEQTFYQGVAFAVLFFGTKIILQMIGAMLDFLADLPLLSTVNRALGGAFGLIEVYLIIFVLLYVAALTPVEQVQRSIDDSSIAKVIVEKTPILSQEIKERWFVQTNQ
ncbi:CvpA family protein [Bacillaceae bacterium SIJ1]|uniref:CvpA family protein n=1 Tax=Litoribacterium kuwaitense TaxID=1398745 RepID=UPI0013EE3E73|nr:CvpA family protein [Litoribacterium kuwaitense]NGP44997.1 CvpA family protein [Litoribacterium kuwaitense]